MMKRKYIIEDSDGNYWKLVDGEAIYSNNPKHKEAFLFKTATDAETQRAILSSIKDNKVFLRVSKIESE